MALGEEGASEARQDHVGYQGVVKGEIGQSGPVRGPQLSHLRLQHFLCKTIKGKYIFYRFIPNYKFTLTLPILQMTQQW